MLRLVCFGSLLIVGCAESTQKPSITNEIPRISWDLSVNRRADKFDWFEFDPIHGAIDGDRWLELKFDVSRSFKGKTELITIYRDGAGATPLSGVSINLPAMTDEEITQELRSLAESWNLPADRIESELPDMLTDPLKRGILLYERGDLTIDVEFCSSFDSERPFSLTISWHWTGA